MEAQKTLNLDGVSYIMSPANAFSAWENLQMLLGAIGRSKMDHPGDGSMASAIGLAFSVMDTRELAAIQRMVFEYTVVKLSEGQPFKLTDGAETHFNQYRAHLPKLLVEGVIYQFEDFFTGIRDVLTGLFPGMTEMLRFLEQARTMVTAPLSPTASTVETTA
ncbi:hypothetical protein MUU49_17475 [Scandinavium goeteborgense]|uniref:phage tail assembly chaperone n=1 Tax=Scandinavium goeteborgense TaxID=1851514 RepID=UPI0021654EED|nr:putative phage tail assembly chaperone [Scandinavium goeteborgense]MCS2154349.1 hypothetical protein [Scandinavium goeteborgense]